MSGAWKQWEGQTIDGKFALRRFIASTDHSAVFLTDRGDPSQKLAIKFIQLDEPLATIQLARWKAAANLSHPNLLRLFESGRCQLGEFNLLYVLLENAEENLSEFLPQRPLTPAETRDVLTPALQALGFLHSESLIHGRVKPSNILAIDDQLKLSSDSLFSLAPGDANHPANALRPASPYDSPESAAGVLTPASDIWSLGMTLVETLTQRLPAFDPSARLDPAVPDTLPAVYLDIARHCLARDPQKRWTVIEVSARLNPGSAAPSASVASVTTAPVAPPAAVPTREQPAPAAPACVAPPRELPMPHKSANPARPVHTQTVAVRRPAKRFDMAAPHLQRPPLFPKLPDLNYLPLAVIAALALLAIVIGPRLLRHSSPQQTASTDLQPSAVSKPAPPASAKSTSKPANKPPSKTPAAVSLSPQPNPKRSEPAVGSVQKASDKHLLPTASNTPGPTTSARKEAAPKSTVDAANRGEILNQVMPDISAKARATIRGTVRVGIKLRVDASGNVVGADIAAPGPSQYFADQALQAAKQWDFAPPKVDGYAVRSEWLVRFEFKPANTYASATQSAP